MKCNCFVPTTEVYTEHWIEFFKLNILYYILFIFCYISIENFYLVCAFGVFLIVQCIVCVILYANYDQCFPSLNWSTLFEHVLE